MLKIEKKTQSRKKIIKKNKVEISLSAVERTGYSENTILFLFNMSEYYNVVPWFNSDEWLTVYDQIYVSSNKIEAHNLLLVWKARCPSLPSGIESTLILLEVLIQDEKWDSMYNDQLLRLAYSSAIMRFVNHMLDTETARGTSLYQAARNLGVPDWIIDLRHDTAHSNNLPSIELLREASSIGLDWLRKNYWDKYKECIQDFKSGQKESQEIPESNKIAALMHFCVSLSFCAHSRCGIKNLSDIPNPSMRESIVSDARDLFGDHVDLSNLKTVSVTSLVNMLNSYSKKLLKSKDAILCANKALLGEDSLFLSTDLLNFLGSSEFYYKSKLNSSYIQCFEVLLTFLHTNNMLLDFILDVIEVTSKGEDGTHKCRLAALWVSEILKALGRSKQFMERMKSTNETEMKSKKRSELKSLYHHWFPNEKAKGLLLDMQKFVPEQLMDIKFLQPIISTYNPYLRYFIKDLLSLVEPNLPNSVTTNICQLAELISSPEKFPIASSKIYNVDDLESETEEVSYKQKSNKELIQDMEVDTSSVNVQTAPYGIWKMSSINSGWDSCPIGLVPNQQ